MTDTKASLTEATDRLVTALHAATERLDGDTTADVEEAWSTYQAAQSEALHAQGGPYPVSGRRGWTWLDDAPGGERNARGEIRCQSRARSPEGVPHRCVLPAAHSNRPCWWPSAAAETPAHAAERG